ncbi:uncharacterized protein LOC106870359 [Octopus bimaculoides]|uniref:Uncharacterized protein n=1 Tax=Octopus bimaculoides TaxID=37653 RepID=A0A0L8HJ53_OCTBM|nr:uncharacterized protein LOC106870359 [Octopus bimaculoides]XP_014771879.1 uncharacterized protein LOC106870359 [Octopus bimaculoides]|eukprot:XP_014771878.1 PREDICTED: spindle pole body component 110-like [Octopus bimaculoides]
MKCFRCGTNLKRPAKVNFPKAASMTSNRGHCNAYMKDVSTKSSIESQYIRNLQYQIYYLEMESRYLRKLLADQKVPERPCKISDDCAQDLPQCVRTKSNKQYICEHDDGDMLKKLNNMRMDTDIEIHRLKQKLAEKDEKLADMEKKMEELKLTASKHVHNLKSIEDNYKCSQTLIEKMVTEKNEQDRVKSELFDANERLQHLESSKKLLSESNERLRIESSNYIREISDLKNRLDMCWSEVDTKNKRLEQCLSELQEMANIKSEKELYARRISECMDQVAKLQSQNNELENILKMANARNVDMETRNRGMLKEKEMLNEDKRLLLNRMAEEEKKIERLKEANYELHKNQSNLDKKLKSVEELKDLQNTLHKQKWEEFGLLANSMHSLSQTMSAQT